MLSASWFFIQNHPKKFIPLFLNFLIVNILMVIFRILLQLFRQRIEIVFTRLHGQKKSAVSSISENRSFCKEILLFIKISKAEIKITSIPNQRAIDERKERVNQFVKLMDLVRGTNYNNKYSFDFQVYQYFILLFKGIYLQLAKDNFKEKLLLSYRSR